MLFTITGKHVEITDAIREHVQDKTDKLPRYYNNISHIEVVIDGNDGGMQSVELIVRGDGGSTFIGKESGDDTYACIDIAVHKVERQLHRKKEKQRNNKHIGSPEEYEQTVSEEQEDNE
jgi:ribosome hibernation promoting factor